MYYLDIVLNGEFQNPNLIRNQLVNYLHINYFGKHKSLRISFPEYSASVASNVGFGSIVRLIDENQESLDLIKNDEIIANGMAGFLVLNQFGSVPETEKFVMFCRYQPKTERQVLKRLKEGQKLSKKYEKCKLPYLVLNSKSSKRKFNMFIKQVEFDDKLDNNKNINSYGLRKKIPWF